VPLVTELSVEPLLKARAFNVVVAVMFKPPEGNAVELLVGSFPLVV
jgi:hypothetical protein